MWQAACHHRASGGLPYVNGEIATLNGAKAFVAWPTARSNHVIHCFWRGKRDRQAIRPRFIEEGARGLYIGTEFFEISRRRCHGVRVWDPEPGL